ncbi:MAG: AP endonuclease [Oscillospiraceae bacterium]|nr:AP endonuclease [Oscillospiraceae bacterium]
MKMDVLGVELELDFFDADQVEIYEQENKEVVERIKEPTQYEGKSNADAFRIQCNIINEFFDHIFGEGTAKKIFHGKNNLRDHMEAFAIVADSAMSSRKEMKALEDRYTSNRAERRQTQKQQNKQNFQTYVGRNYRDKGGKSQNR